MGFLKDAVLTAPDSHVCAVSSAPAAWSGGADGGMLALEGLALPGRSLLPRTLLCCIMGQRKSSPAPHSCVGHQPSILAWAPMTLSSAAHLMWQETTSPQLMTVRPRVVDPARGSHTGHKGFHIRLLPSDSQDNESFGGKSAWESLAAGQSWSMCRREECGAERGCVEPQHLRGSEASCSALTWPHLGARQACA